MLQNENYRKNISYSFTYKFFIYCNYSGNFLQEKETLNMFLGDLNFASDSS